MHGTGRRLLKAVGVFFGSLGLLVVFVVALVAGVLLHLGHPAARSVAVDTTNQMLEGSFKGRIEVEGLSDLSPFGLSGADAKIFDPQGRLVAVVRGAAVRLDTETLVRSLLAKTGPLHIPLELISVRHARVQLIENEAGSFSIAEAFEPREVTPEDPNARPTLLELEQLRLDHAWIHGKSAALPVIDAEIARLRASATLHPERIEAKLPHANLWVRSLPTVQSTRGELRQVSLNMPAGGDLERLQATAVYEGSVGEVPILLDARYDREVVNARVQAGPAKPEQVHAMVPALQPTEPITATISVQGTLPRLEADAEVRAGTSLIAVDATAQLPPGARGVVDVRLQDVNWRAFDRTAEPTRLNASASVTWSGLGEELSGKFELATRPFQLGATPVPDVRVQGEFTDEGAQAAGWVGEPGAPTQFEVDFRSGQGGTGEVRARPATVEFSVESNVADLGKVKRLELPAQGRARIRANGRVTLGETPSVDARLTTVAHDVNVGGNQVERAEVNVVARGPLESPELTTRATVEDVDVAGYHYDRATVTTRGPLSSLQVNAEAQSRTAPNLTASLRASPQRGLLEDVQLQLARRDDTVAVNARQVSFAGGKTRVEGLSLRGAGELDASAEVRPNGLRVKARGDAVDLGKLARLVGYQKQLPSGVASVDVDLRVQGTRAYGRVLADVDQLAIDDLKGGRATLDLKLEGRQVSGTVYAGIGGLVDARARAEELRLPPGDLNAEALRRTTGELSLRVRADLDRLRRYVPEDMLPVDRAEGRVVLDVDVDRKQPALPPDVLLRLRTEDLVLVGKALDAPIESAAEARQRKPWRTSGLDVDVRARLAGETGRTQLEGYLVDRRGPIARVDLDTRLPRATLLQGQLPDDWTQLPVEARLTVQDRDLGQLPPLVRPDGLEGSVSAELKVEGTAAAPKLSGWVHGTQLRSTDSAIQLPLDVMAKVDYDGQRGAVRVDVDQRRTRVLHLAADMQLPWREVIDGGALPPVRGETELVLDDFPLHALAPLKDRQIAGFLSANLKLRGLGTDARLDGEVEVNQLRVGRAEFKSARVDVRANDQRLLAAARIVQHDGWAALDARVPLDWGAQLAPSLSEEGPVVARFRAYDFRAALVQPLVEGTVSTIDGRIDADVSATVGAGQNELKGHLNLDRGVLMLPTIGQEFRDIQAKVSFNPNGLVKLERASARGFTGRVLAAGSARLDGFTFQTARLKARIPEGEELPLTVEGVSMGDAWGEVEVTAVTAADQSSTRVSVAIPRFHLELPQTTKNSVQQLEDDPRIKTGVYMTNTKFVGLPLQPLQSEADPGAPSGPPHRLFVSVDLGREVWVRKGTTLRVRLDGKVNIDVLNEAHVTGQIQLPRGTLDVQGKQFRIETGTVTLQPANPANPIIVATAFWESPDGYRVFADFAGTVESGNLTLRSEPPLQENEILSLLLFGSPDGQFGVSDNSGESSDAATALSVGGGAATQGLNRALGDLTNLDVQARVDTSSGSPQPELAFQVSRRLTAELGYNVGDPGPGQPQDRTFLTLDWRIRQRWSLSTTFGDRGTTIWDLLWRYRY